MKAYKFIFVMLLVAGCKKEEPTKELVKADFTYSGQLQNFTPIQFNNLSSGASSYSWTFGDGTTSNEQNPIHTFRKPGNYSVELLSSAQGASNKKAQHLTLAQADTLSLILDAVSGRYRFTKKLFRVVTYGSFGNGYSDVTTISNYDITMLVRRVNNTLQIDSYRPMNLLGPAAYQGYYGFVLYTGVNAANYNRALFKQGTDSLRFEVSFGGAGASNSTTYIGKKEN